MSSKFLTVVDLKSRLSYNEDTGIFRWVVATRGSKSSRIAGSKHSKGYWVVGINKRRYMAHNLAWLYMTGDWPPDGMEVDHKDTDRANNRWLNLRLATKSQQQWNKRDIHRRKYPHLPRGVKPNGAGFSARCQVRGKNHHIGTFQTVEEAKTAYDEFSNWHHGEFKYQHEV